VQALDVGAVTTATGIWLPYLVLEWLDGQTLARLIEARRAAGQPKLSVDEAIDLLEPAAQALAVAHRQKVAHRDVKPENIFVTMVDGRRTTKVLDFGIAKVLTHHASFAATATQKQASAFTPSYGAPEQFNKKRGATGPWTDVFALALIVVELVSGERALDGDDATQLYIASADPASRPTLRYHGVNASDSVEDVLLHALAVDPSDRFQDAGSFWTALCDAAGKAPGAETPAPDVSETGEFVHRHAIDLAAPLGQPSPAPPRPEVEASDQATAAAATVRDDHGFDAEAMTEAATAEPRASREGRTKASARATSHTRKEREKTRDSSLPWMPLMLGLSVAGAGALYWQLMSIGPTPVEKPKTTATASLTATPAPRPIAPIAPSASVTAPPSASALASTSPLPSASVDAGHEGGAGGAPATPLAPTKIEPPEGMLLVAPAEASGLKSFFIDKNEVSTKAYLECVMAGRCKKATRVILTEESARALGVPDVGDALVPEKLAAAWEKRCNHVRGASDHPINCVGFGSAEDYCLWRKKRLPTSAEWTVAASSASGRRYPWGDEAPDCSFACYGLNGSCVATTTEVATCTIGSRARDFTHDRMADFAGNVAEWVSDEGSRPTSDGPAWRLLRGGSFLDEAAGLVTTTERAAPPVTAYVSIGFRCAQDAPRPNP
jgi:serine/threonine-protein kinase